MEIVIDNKQVNVNTIKIADIHSWDYPEYCDAFVSYAEFVDGSKLDIDQLNHITDNYQELVNNLAHQINS